MAKKAKKKPAAKKKKKPFRREDIPNISPQLGDVADPFLAAEQLGVDVRDLEAFLVKDGATGRMMNDFFVSKTGHTRP